MQNQMVNLLLNQLKNKNPQGYNSVIQLMNSGKSPNQVLNELIQSGQFTNEQINQAQRIANQYSQNSNTPNIKKF